MKRKSLTPWLPFSSRLLLRPLPDYISLATWALATFSQHHCIKSIKDMLRMKIYPYLSYRREINETDVNYTCNLQKVWDSSNSLNRNSCSLFNLYSICNSSDQWTIFLTRWNAITVRKGRGKKTILRYFIFLNRLSLSLRSFRSLTLRRNHLHSQPFKLSETVCKFYCRTEKQFPLLVFCFVLYCFVYKIFAVTIRNIIP